MAHPSQVNPLWGKRSTRAGLRRECTECAYVHSVGYTLLAVVQRGRKVCIALGREGGLHKTREGLDLLTVVSTLRVGEMPWL